MAGRAKITAALLGLAALVPAEMLLEWKAAPAPDRLIRSRFNDMRNYDLKREGIRTASRLRSYAAKLRLQEIESLSTNSAVAFDKTAMLDEYAITLKIDAVQLRDELMARLPRTKRPDLPYMRLDFASSAEMLEKGASMLETLADLLPHMQYRDEQRTLPAVPRVGHSLLVV